MSHGNLEKTENIDNVENVEKNDKPEGAEKESLKDKIKGFFFNGKESSESDTEKKDASAAEEKTEGKKSFGDSYKELVNSEDEIAEKDLQTNEKKEQTEDEEDDYKQHGDDGARTLETEKSNKSDDDLEL
ncbi:hypothetical protein [Ruminococcus sp.]|uniref:hypothetical protein n=1 Tax=Ruminococcus sp. TaxID=41978 RepID=UPI0025DC330B|nr:hypothetical protein [Ruminococcus sp.]MBR1433105.1 hypothetical protein [Ruminococcus sp.]